MSNKLTDGNVKSPVVSVYPVFRSHSNGKHVLLCQARGMFPIQVKFTWQAEDQSGQKVELKDDEMLEQKDEDQEIKITSMLIVDKEKVKNNIFTCSVQHDISVEEQRVDIPRSQQEGNALLFFSIESFCYLVGRV